MGFDDINNLSTEQRLRTGANEMRELHGNKAGMA